MIANFLTLSDSGIKKVFKDKYSNFNDKIEKYLEIAYIEVIEADKQQEEKWTEKAIDEMKKLEIKNNAQFLFKLRYPSEVMVKLNEKQVSAFKNAGFDFFDL